MACSYLLDKYSAQQCSCCAQTYGVPLTPQKNPREQHSVTLVSATATVQLLQVTPSAYERERVVAGGSRHHLGWYEPPLVCSVGCRRCSMLTCLTLGSWLQWRLGMTTLEQRLVRENLCMRTLGPASPCLSCLACA
jgi:hypothetical protein